MKVSLIKTDIIDFSLNDDKCEKVSYNTLKMLSGYNETECDNGLPKMVVFKTRDEFVDNAWKYDIDETQEVLINNKGNIFCHIKGENKKMSEHTDEPKTDTDVTTDTKENKGE